MLQSMYNISCTIYPVSCYIHTPAGANTRRGPPGHCRLLVPTTLPVGAAQLDATVGVVAEAAQHALRTLQPCLEVGTRRALPVLRVGNDVGDTMGAHAIAAAHGAAAPNGIATTSVIATAHGDAATHKIATTTGVAAAYCIAAMRYITSTDGIADKIAATHGIAATTGNGLDEWGNAGALVALNEHLAAPPGRTQTSRKVLPPRWSQAEPPGAQSLAEHHEASRTLSTTTPRGAPRTAHRARSLAESRAAPRSLPERRGVSGSATKPREV